MIRFRNPGTQYSTQIQVIKELYRNLGTQKSFSLDDMAIVIAKSKLMTAYGYAGKQAIELSNTDQESLNSAKMNAKMYAEVFRMLGWVTPYSNKTSYPLVFTFIGAHVATTDGDLMPLYEQCVLGINNPTELTDNLSYTENSRFFKCALRTLIDLGGIMYKHELCLGPMSINDNNEEEYQQMISNIKKIRGSEQRLKEAFKSLADSLRMKEDPVDNCTRLPIAFMKSCGWIESVNDTSLYNKSKICFKITQHGIDVYNSIKNMVDIRLNDFNKFDIDVQNALIRFGLYSMLLRSDYDLSSVIEIIKQDAFVIEKKFGNNEILFSPCQTLNRQKVEKALGLELENSTESTLKLSTFDSKAKDRETAFAYSHIKLDTKNMLVKDFLTSPVDKMFLLEVSNLKTNNLSNEEIVNYLFAKYKTATQSVFYPLISTLFRIMGLNCSFSRPGDNGARWDAIIDDEKRSIPIEIKSPTEEEHLSIKAIRQALENKIILLSRKTHITDIETTSLAVGYYLPNERAEVFRLIQDIKATFGYRIGVIDFKSLLTISISILLDNKGFDINKIFLLEGLINASF